MYEIVTFPHKTARKFSNFKVWRSYVRDYLKIIYDEIEMLSLKGIELLCNKRKKLKIHGLGTRLIVFGVLIEPFPRFCRTFYITYINACTKFPSPMLMSPFFWHNQIFSCISNSSYYITYSKLVELPENFSGSSTDWKQFS